MTLAGSILTALSDNWSLTGAGTKSAIHFATKNWYDTAYTMKPQVSVSDLAEAEHKFFLSHGGTLIIHSYPRYVVNCWVPIPRGASGTSESQLCEDMRYEVCRIVAANRGSVASLTSLVPSNLGVPLHEVNAEPRILRYEITLVGAHDRIST